MSSVSISKQGCEHGKQQDERTAKREADLGSIKLKENKPISKNLPQFESPEMKQAYSGSAVAVGGGILFLGAAATGAGATAVAVGAAVTAVGIGVAVGGLGSAAIRATFPSLQPLLDDVADVAINGKPTFETKAVDTPKELSADAAKKDLPTFAPKVDEVSEKAKRADTPVQPTLQGASNQRQSKNALASNDRTIE